VPPAIAVPPPFESAPSDWPVHRISVGQYHRLTKSGVFTEDDNIELLEGWIISKMAKNPPQDSRVMWTQETLRRLLPPGWHCRNQCSLDTTDSVPEPDVCVVRGDILDFEDRHPAGDDVALVVEVADSTLAGDRLKRRVYSRAGIPTYWIVNLVDSRLEVFTDPRDTGSAADYSNEVILTRTDVVTLPLPNHVPLEIAIADLVR
jgi:Uma2 family endonuclease